MDRARMLTVIVALATCALPAGQEPAATPAEPTDVSFDPGLLGKGGHHPRVRLDRKEEAGLIDKCGFARRTSGRIIGFRESGSAPIGRMSETLRPGFEGVPVSRVDGGELRDRMIRFLERRNPPDPGSGAAAAGGRGAPGSPISPARGFPQESVAICAVAVVACGTLLYTFRK